MLHKEPGLKVHRRLQSLHSFLSSVLLGICTLMAKQPRRPWGRPPLPGCRGQPQTAASLATVLEPRLEVGEEGSDYDD